MVLKQTRTPIGLKGGKETAAIYRALDGALDLLTPEFDSSLIPDTKLARNLSMRISRTRGKHIRNGLDATLRFSSSPKMHRTNVPGDDRFARQRALIGYSQNDEERSDDLSRTPIR